MGDPAIQNSVTHLEDQARYINGLVPAGGIAVQAGGWQGKAPLLLAKHFALVYTYEPCLDNFRRLVASTPDNVIPIYGAIGDSRGTCGLSIDKQNSGNHRTHPEGHIPLWMVDDLELSRCDLIWLDIQGDEYEALIGARNTISLHRPVIGFEYSPDKAPQTHDVEELLLSNGYEYHGSKFLDRFYISGGEDA